MTTQHCKDERRVTGAEFRRLMRVHRKTIRGLSQQFCVTQAAIRRYRERGARGFVAEELTFMCTGVWPAPAASVEHAAAPRAVYPVQAAETATSGARTGE